MRHTVTIFLILVSTAKIFSQDHIITKNGKDLEVTVTEIRQTDVTFTMFTDSSKTPYVMDKTEIEKIVFENGTEERFGDQNNETIINNNNNTNRNKDPDKIYTTDGKVIYCEVVEIKRFGVNYVPVNSSNNYVEYLANTKIDRIEYANGDVTYISGSPKNAKNRKDLKDFSYLSPHYVSIGVGPAIPFGILGNAGTSSTASTGTEVQLDATYYLFRGMGFSLTGGYMWNPYIGTDQRALAMGNVPATATDVSVKVGDWHNFYAAGGLGYYNEYGRFMLDYRAMFGAFFSIYPTAQATYTDGGVTTTSMYYAHLSTSFIFGGQISGRYFINRKFQIKFNASTLFGRANFQGIIRKDHVDGQTDVESVAAPSGPINLSWVNITVGVAYTLGK